MNLDEQFKNQLNQEEFLFKEEYWQAASALIDAHQKKKKRGLIWWSIVPVLALLLSVGTYFIISNTEEEKILGSLQTDKQTNLHQEEALAAAPKAPKVSNPSVETNSRKDPRKDNALIYNPVKQELQKTAFKNNPTVKNKRLGIDANAASSSIPSSAIPADIKSIPSTNFIEPIASLNTNLALLASKEMEHLSILDATLNTDKKLDPQLYFTPYFTLGAYVGLNTSNKKIAFEALFDETLKNKRLQEEKSKVSKNYGIELLYQFNPFWSISGGLEYANYTEKINYSGISKEQLQIQDNSYLLIKDTSFWTSGFVTVNGVETYYQNTGFRRLKDTVLVVDIDSNTYIYTDKAVEALNGENTFSYLEFPFMLGYQFPYKHMEVQVQSGFAMGFLHRSSVRYVVDENSVNNQELVVVNNQVASVLLRLSLLYHLDRKMQVYVQPSYKKQVSNSVEGVGRFQQRLSSYNFNVGFRYVFR